MKSSLFVLLWPVIVSNSYALFFKIGINSKTCIMSVARRAADVEKEKKEWADM